MVFSSLIFLCIFLPAFLLLYNLSKNISYKNVVLTAASFVFYAWGEPIWVVLLLLSAAAGYFNGLIIDRFRGGIGAKAGLVTSVVINLGMLCVFKYSGFFIESLNSAFGLSYPVPEIALPIGISFYTFQTLSYTIDLYKGRVKVQSSVLRFLTYVSMFPQLTAGPIVRYRDAATELRSRSVTSASFAAGVRRFVCGLSKKVLLANSIAVPADAMLSSIHMTTLSAWLGIVCYAFEIYFDFSGYSDMAIGLAKMLGFKFAENFEHPYISKSVTDFWRRWHISLSSFFRDYVYIPLGGNRKRHVLNIMIVWMLTGLWHGASLNFILWGLYYGIVLLIEKKLFKGILGRLVFPLDRFYTGLVVLFGWGIFYYTDLTELTVFVKTLFFASGRLYDLTSVSTLCQNAKLLIVCAVAVHPLPKILYNHFSESRPFLSAIVEPIVITAGFALCFISLVGETYNPFLYFRF